MQSSFAAWADPQFVFQMPDETPFGIDQSLHGRPIIDYQGQPSMHDILRLQRLVQQLASKVRIFMGCQEANSTNSKLLYESHHEIMALAEATFKEMSLQSFRADKALAVGTLWDSLSLYLNHCAAQAAGSQSFAAAADAAGCEPTEPLNRGASTSTRLAALERENLDMKTQIANLNARLAQHAQHAEQLLAGTEAFFGDKAGTVIGQPLEEEDSDSNMSFSSAQERSFSRPMSAASSYTSAASKELSSSSPRSASPALHMRGLSRALGGSSKALGGPLGSGVSTASFETAHEDALSRLASGQDDQLQTDTKEEGRSCAARHSKRKALKAFLHKLRHAPATPAAAAASDATPASTLSPGQQEGRAFVGNGPSFGAAADRAAAHQFARSLSHKTSMPTSLDRHAMPKSPFAEVNAAAPRGDDSEGPQQGPGVPPPTRVRTLSRHFSERTQQPQTARGGVGTPKQPDAPGIPGASVPDAGASTAGPRSYGPASKASSKGSSRSPSIAGEVPEAAASPQPSESSAKSASAAGDRLSPKHRAVSRSLTSAPSAFAFGSSSGSAPKVSRSTTGLPSGTPQPFAFGSTAAGKLADSNAEPTPLQLGLGKAADAAASAGNVVGHLFGFSVADSTKARSGFGGGVFGGLGSGFSFAAGSSSAGLPSGIKCSTRGIAAEAAASKEDDEQEEAGEEEKKEAEALHAEVEDQETGDGEDGQTPEKEAEDQGEDKEGGAERDRGNLADADGKPQTADQAAPGHDTQSDTAQEAQGEEDDCRLTLPDNLFSEDEDTAAAAAIESDNDVGVGQGHKPANGASGHGVGHADPGSESHAESEVDAGQHAGESEAADDDESLEHVEDDVSHNEQDVTDAVAGGAPEPVVEVQNASVERAGKPDEANTDEDTKMSDDDSQYEDWTEGDEEQSEDETSNHVVASDSLEVDEASFVDSREDVDESSSDDESID